MNLCQHCSNKDIEIEIRNGATNKYESCMYYHQWFKQVRKPEQCRDYEPESTDEGDLE